MKPWRHTDGKIGGALLFSEVITKEVEARHRLAESEERLRLALDAAELGIWRWEVAKGTRVLQWDARCKALSGLPPDAEVTYDIWANAITPEDRTAAEAGVVRALDPADPHDEYVCEYRVRHPDGTVLWVYATGRAFFEPDPAAPSGRRVVSIAGTIRDVTQAHAAKDALKEKEERLSAALRSGKFGVYDYDPLTRIIKWDSRMYRLWGVPEGEPVTYETFEAGVHPEDVAAVRAAVAKSLHPNESRHIECEYRVVNRSDRKVRSVFADGDVTFDAATGEPCRIVGIVQDITERKTIENALRESEGRLRTIVDTAVDAIVVIDEEGLVQSANLATERLFGFETHEVVGSNISMLMPRTDRIAHDSHISKFLRTGRAKIIGVGREVQGVRKDGSFFPLDLAVAEWRADGKRFFTGIMRDITLRKRREDQVQALLGEVNHRSKNLLAVVHAIARQTLATKPDEFMETFGERIQALSANQDLLIKNSWIGVYLDELVRSQLAPFNDLFGSSIHLEGPPLLMSSSAAQAIGLALHELATNAGKYGALSNRDGRVEINWGLECSETGEETFVMTWREEGGPPVSEPKRQGFGSVVIGLMVESSLDAKVELSFPVTGARWRLVCRADDALGVQASNAPKAAAPNTAGPQQ